MNKDFVVVKVVKNGLCREAVVKRGTSVSAVLDTVDWLNITGHGIYLNGQVSHLNMNIWKDCEISIIKKTKEIVKEYRVEEEGVVDMDYNTANKNATIKNNKEEGVGADMFNLKKVFAGAGKVEGGKVALTFDGNVAVQRKDGDYVRYDANTDTLVNMMEFVIKQANKFMYIFPVMQVQAGDIIKRKETFYQVLEVKPSGQIKGINLNTGGKSSFVKEVNVFGFNFYYKVVSLFNQGTNNTMFGMNPMMLMMMDKKQDDDDNKFMDMMLMASMFGGGQMGGMNPMMFMMMGDGKFDMETMMMMQMFQQPQAQMNPMANMMNPMAGMFGGFQGQGFQTPNTVQNEAVEEETSEEE